jgi:hypothetical protein
VDMNAKGGKEEAFRLITLVNKDFVKCWILPHSYVFFGAESEYYLRICPNGFIFFVMATHIF